MAKLYFITCLNPDCGEDDSTTGTEPIECDFCGTTDIEVSDGGEV